jgi:hypothetical protein
MQGTWGAKNDNSYPQNNNSGNGLNPNNKKN